MRLSTQTHRFLTRTYRYPTARYISNTASRNKWEGSGTKDHTNEGGDKHNVQQDATKVGKEERAKGDSVSRATNEGSGGVNKKTKEEFPEAPDTIGMQDERGDKGR